MKSKIGGSTKFTKDLELQLLNLKAVGYNFAELGLGLPSEPNKVFEDKLKRLRNIINSQNQPFHYFIKFYFNHQ